MVDINTPPKVIVFDDEMKNQLREGVRILAKAVGSTLGPKGRNVVIEAKYGVPYVTRDGVTVAQHTNVEHPIQNLGINIVKQAADKSGAVAGDGTTTATILAAALINEGTALQLAPIEVNRAYDKFLEVTLKKLDKMSKPVAKGDIKRIATVSANNDESLGAMIAEAFEYASASGMITVEDSKDYNTSVEKIEGSYIDTGFLSPYFVTNTRRETCELINPIIFISDSKIDNPDQFFQILRIAQSVDRPLLVIADDMDPQSLAYMVINKMKGALKCCAIKAPAFGDRRLETLKDLAALTSATLVSETVGMRLKDVEIGHFGTAAKVVISKDETIIVSPDKDEATIEERMIGILAELEKYTDGYNYDKLVERRARLKGALSIIRVGAATDSDLKEKRDRVDDAIRATRAAVDSGYLTGGGVPLARISTDFIKAGASPVEIAFGKALRSPIATIASNANENPETVISRLLNEDLEYNALSNDYTKSLVKDGVIDPTMVTKQALINAVSAAKMILLCSTAMYEVSRAPAYNPGSLEDYAG